MKMKSMEEICSFIRQSKVQKIKLKENIIIYKQQLSKYSDTQTTNSNVLNKLKKKIQEYKHNYSDSTRFLRTETESYTEISIDTYEEENLGESLKPPTNNLVKDLREQLYSTIKRNKEITNELAESKQLLQTVDITLETVIDDIDRSFNKYDLKGDFEKLIEKDLYHSPNTDFILLKQLQREVQAIKKSYCDLKFEVKEKLKSFHYDVDDVTKEVPAAISQLLIHLDQKKKLHACALNQLEKENFDLRNQLANLNDHYNKLRSDFCSREEKSNFIQNEYEILKRNYEELRYQAESTYSAIEDSQVLQKAIAEIAKNIVSDFNNKNDKAFDTVLDSFAKKIRFCQTTDNRNLADNTVIAVNASISNYNKSLKEANLKYQELYDINTKIKVQLEELNSERLNLINQLSDLNDKFEDKQMALCELIKERENLQCNLENIRSEKFLAEQMNTEFTLVNENLVAELNKKELLLSKLRNEVENKEEEKIQLQDDIRNKSKKEEIHIITLSALENGNSRLKEEILLLQEDIKKMCLKSDMLEQQLNAEKISNTKYENEIKNLKHMLDLVSNECCSLKAELEKIEATSENYLKANDNLQNEKGFLKNEQISLCEKISELNSDIDILKKELIGSEKIRLQIESEKKSIDEKLICFQRDNEKLEEFLCQVQREKGETCNKLTAVNRKNDFLNSELLRLKQRMEQATQINNRLNKNIEELIKQNESKQSLIDKLEKDIYIYQETNTTIKTEKNALEGRLHDSLSTIDNKEHKISQLEDSLKEQIKYSENVIHELQLAKKELETSEKSLSNLKIKFSSDITKLENDFVQKLSKLKQLIDDNILQFNTEKALLQSSSEKRLQQALCDLELEKNAELEKLKNKFNALQDQHNLFVQQHEETLMEAENEKQNVFNCAQKEKQLIILRLDQAIQDLEKEAESHLKSNRDAKCQHDQDKRLITTLKDEVSTLKTELDNIRLHLEDVKHTSDLIISKSNEEKEHLFKDMSELKTIIKLEEDKNSDLKARLNECSMKLSEAESLAEGLRKDLMDHRKQLTDVTLERNTFAESAKNLRDNLKQLETSKQELKKNFENSLNKIRQLEDAQNKAFQQNDDLAKRLKGCEIEATKTLTSLSHIKEENDKLKGTISEKDILEKELRSRLNNETEERERLSHQLIHATKQIADLEGLLNSTRQELHHTICQANQDRHKWSNFEHGLQNQYEETRINEQKLQDKKHNLEICLADATQQIQELKAQLAGIDNKNTGLEKEKAFLLNKTRELESKLSTISNMLRCICGIQPDGSIIIPGHNILHNTLDHNHKDFTNSLIIEPEQATIGMKALMHYINQLERDQEDLSNKLSMSEKKLLQSSEQEKRIESKLNKLQLLLGTTQNEKVNAETKYLQKSAALKNLESVLKAKVDEIRSLHDNKNELETVIHDINLSKKHLEDHLEQCRQGISCLESENIALKDELSHMEAKVSRLDIQKIALEGDLQRQQMILQEKDNNLKVLQDKIENQVKCISSLEECCSNMKLTIDQLKCKNEQAAILEAELRLEIKNIQKIKNNQEHILNNDNEKIKQLQKSLINSENERRVLSERLESAQQCITETKRQNQSILTQLQKYQEQIANLEIQKSNIDSQLKLLQWRESNEDSNRYETSTFDTNMPINHGNNPNSMTNIESEQHDIQQNKKINLLENELMMLKRQLQNEASWKDKYDCIKNKTGQELLHLRKALGSSLRNVAHDPHANMIQTES